MRAVTLLRLTGELLGWSPKLFARTAGGGASPVGIVWLIPIFGIYFALRLAQTGEAPPTVGRALGLAKIARSLGPAANRGGVRWEGFTNHN